MEGAAMSGMNAWTCMRGGFRKTKVDKFESQGLFADQDISGLEISMHHRWGEVMQKVEAHGNVIGKLERGRGGIPLTFVLNQ